MSGENCMQLSLVSTPSSEEPQAAKQAEPQPQPQVFPGTLQGVLNWTVQNAGEHLSRVVQERNPNDANNGDGAAAAAAIHAMDPERRRFLDEVFKQFSQDPFESLKKSIAKLKNKDSTEEEKVEALESIQDEVEDLNIAEVLHSAGGFVPVVSFLAPTASAELQWRAADIIASISQNFPKVQDLVVPFKVIPRLVALLDSSFPEQVRLKALRALSCLARGHEVLTKQCLEEPRFMGYVCECLDSGSEHLQVKASHLLRHFFTSSALVENCGPLIGALVRSLQKQPHESTLWEHAMAALADASHEHAQNSALIQTDYAELREILASRLTYIQAKGAADQEAHNEELEYAGKLKLLFP